MTERTPILERIDNYLNGNMSEAERLSFEQKIAEDESLAAKVDEMKLTNEAVYYANLSVLKESIRQDLRDIEYRPDSPTNWKLLVTTTVITLGLLAGGYTYLTNNENPSGKNYVTADAVLQNELADQAKSISAAIENKEPTGDPTDKKTRSPQPKNPIPEKIKTTDALAKITDQDKKELSQIVNIPEKKDLTAVVENSQIQSDKIPDKSPEHEAVAKTDTCIKSFEIKTSPACKGKPTGTITIVTQDPEELNVEINKISRPHSNLIFQEFNSGIHEVTVTSGNNCSFTERVIIDEKWCPVNTSYSFNPDYGEKWEINYEKGDAGKFVIYNSFGKELYVSQFGIGNEYWDGTDYNGTKAATGNYVAIIKYSDGRNERVELTIVR